MSRRLFQVGITETIKAIKDTMRGKAPFKAGAKNKGWRGRQYLAYTPSTSFGRWMHNNRKTFSDKIRRRMLLKKAFNKMRAPLRRAKWAALTTRQFNFKR